MDLPMVITALGIPGIAIVAWAATQVAEEWRKAKKVDADTALKQDMLQRGMSADDIVRVLQCKTTVSEEAELGEFMASEGYKADEIANVHQAFAGATSSVRAVARRMIKEGYKANDILKVIDSCQQLDSNHALNVQ